MTLMSLELSSIYSSPNQDLGRDTNVVEIERMNHPGLPSGTSGKLELELTTSECWCGVTKPHVSDGYSPF